MRRRKMGNVPPPGVEGNTPEAIDAYAKRQINANAAHVLKKKRDRLLARRAVVAFFLLFFVPFRIWDRYFRDKAADTINSCHYSQLLSEIEDDVLDVDVYAQTLKEIHSHPILHNESKMMKDGEHHVHTQGVIARFSERGIKFLYQDKAFQQFAFFFERFRIEEANAWCFSLIMERGCGKDEYVLPLHVHDNVAISRNLWGKQFLAHQVDMWYAEVPEDVQGGLLELFHYNGTAPPGDDAKAAKVVEPKTNRLVRFRGDAHLRITAYEPVSKPVIKLVLEQYAIEGYNMKTYTVTRKRDLEIMKK